MVESLKGKDLLQLHVHSRKSNTLTTQSAMKILSNIAPVIGAVLLLTSSGCNHTPYAGVYHPGTPYPSNAGGLGLPENVQDSEPENLSNAGTALIESPPEPVAPVWIQGLEFEKPPASSNYPKHVAVDWVDFETVWTLLITTTNLKLHWKSISLRRQSRWASAN